MGSWTLSVSAPVARVRHICDWCGTEIPPNEKYQRWTGINSGDFCSTAMHLDCDAAMRDDVNNDYEQGVCLDYPHPRGVSCK